MWIPLRCPEHLDRGAEGRLYGLGERRLRPNDLCAWIGCAAPAALLLAQCGHLQTIDAERAPSPESLRDRMRLVRVARQTAGWVGRYRDDGGIFPDRTFEGEIVSDDQNWSVAGIEARGSESLRHLRSQPDWPQSPQWRNGRYGTVPRKALAHAAVTVLRPVDRDAELLGTRLRWAVFLPLDDDAEPSSSSAIIESDGPSPAWEIILHGYFWPSQDRRSIPGVTREFGNAANDGDMRIRWNRALCEDLLLPLLPSALANAVVGVDERAARRLLGAVVRSDMVKDHLASVRRRHWLLPIVADCRVRWNALDANACPRSFHPKVESGTGGRSQAIRGLLRQMRERRCVHRPRCTPIRGRTRRLDRGPPRMPPAQHSRRCVCVPSIFAVDRRNCPSCTRPRRLCRGHSRGRNCPVACGKDRRRRSCPHDPELCLARIARRVAGCVARFVRGAAECVARGNTGG